MANVPEGGVLVVGAGPTGLVLTNLLGRYGIPATVIERAQEACDEPRAVSIDDASMRTLQAVGLLDNVADVVMDGTGTKYHGRDGRVLAYARGDARPLGHAVKNPVDQPDLVRALVRGAERFPHVSVRFGNELVGLEHDESGAVARVSGPEGERELRCRWVVGCDGGRSAVRAHAAITMRGATVDEPWIVVDVDNDPHDERYAMHHGDPRRPHVIVTGLSGRCRYELLLLPGEDPALATRFDFVRELVAPYRDLSPADVRRCIVYRFHALVADRWRCGRVLLAGDAAHMMPPFAAQGLNSGLRDAFNLAWKLALVERGEAGPGLLDTYEVERRPHAEAMVRFSQRLGAVMMTTDPVRAALRDVLVRWACRVGPVRRYLTELRFKPVARLTRGVVLVDGSDLVGRALPQPYVLDEAGRRIRLDETLGDGFALVVVDGPASWQPSDPLWTRLRARTIVLRLDDRLARPRPGAVQIADADGVLSEQLAAQRGRVICLRPDRFVAGTFAPDDEARFARALQRALHAATDDEQGRVFERAHYQPVA
jgi:3-(3-hydroxy-phenyl)propionate hydroxylase